MTDAELRATLVAALREALDDLDPAALVERALPPLPPKSARVRIVAAGKAAVAMTRGAFATWGDRIEDALVVVPSLRGLDLPRTRVIEAGHPLPDGRSVAAADEFLARAGELGERDVLLALISVGASALLALPPEGFSLEEKRAAVAALLDGGAPIQAVNTVRRHLSRIKGGRLAIAAAPARTLTLIVSDVVRGEAHDVGSGPSVPDLTSVADAEAILARFTPSLAGLPLSPSLAPRTFGVRTRAKILADPDDLAQRLAARLAERGFRARAEPADQGDAVEVAARRARLAATLAKGEAVAIACEPTLALPSSRGAGGRAGFVALAALHLIPADVAFLSAASDGVDGSSGSAGALVLGTDALRLTVDEAKTALERFDDAPTHRGLGTSLDLGPTGHNLTDVHVLARRA